MSWFPPSDELRSPFDLTLNRLRGVIDHVNDAHVLDSLLIVWTVGEQPQAQTARLEQVTRFGMQFGCRVDGDDRDVWIYWTQPVSTWRELQVEMHAVNAQAYEDWVAAVLD